MTPRRTAGRGGRGWWRRRAGPAMPKRSCPFGEAAPLQLKTRVGLRELSRGVRGEEYRREVFGEGEGGREGPRAVAGPGRAGPVPELPGLAAGCEGSEAAPNPPLPPLRQSGPGGCSSGAPRPTWRAPGPPAPPPPGRSAARRSPAGRPRMAERGGGGADSSSSATTGDC